ncbi:MAG: two-component system sensor histidine kinase NtrB [Ignavibacteriales bacterium]
MRRRILALEITTFVAAACIGLCRAIFNEGVVTSGEEWHLLAEFGSGSLAALIVAFSAMYYRAGGEAPAVLVGLAYLSPTLVAVFLMTILPVVLLASNIADLGIFAGATGALAFSMLMTIGSAFARRPSRGDLGSMIGLAVGVTLLSGAGAAGIMDLLATTYGPGPLFHLDASPMASIVAGTGTVAASYFCWKAGGRLNRRISVSQAIAATGHLAVLTGAGSLAVLVFSHLTRILAQMHLFSSMFQETGDLMEEQKRLSTQYRIYRWALDSVPIGVVFVNRAGKIETFNREMQETFGVSEPEMAGKCASEAAGLVGARISPEEWLQSLAPENGREFQIRGRDGSTVVLESRSFPIESGDGMAGGSVSILRDLTEEKRLEAELRASERLIIAGSMAKVVSSRLAEPIKRMKWEITHSLGSAEGEARGFLTLSLHEVERLESLMRDLCFLQAPRKLNLRLVSLGEIAQRVLELNRDGISRKGAVTNIRMSPRDNVMADRYRIQQVVTNMVRNAVEAVDQGGVIGVETRVDGGRGTVALDVYNTGSAILESDLPRVFEPFFSTKASGTGLGLSVCRRIIQDHGGEIHIRNVDGGVLCTIELPTCYPTVIVNH